MRKSKTIILLFCGIVFGLAAFPVFAQETKDVEINRRPMRDFGDYLKAKIERGEIDLDKSFKVVLEGVLTQDGKLDRKKSKFTLTEGDKQMSDIAKSGIEAVSDSGWFIYLRNFGAEQIKITVAQDGESFSAIIECEQKDENKAKTMASGLNTVLQLVKMQNENGNRKVSEDEKLLINGFQSSRADGKNFILNFALPKQTFKEMILREVKKANNNQSGE